MDAADLGYIMLYNTDFASHANGIESKNRRIYQFSQRKGKGTISWVFHIYVGTVKGTYPASQGFPKAMYIFLSSGTFITDQYALWKEPDCGCPWTQMV